MKILVTGGAGYIGSITAQQLSKKGHEVLIYDSMENGHDFAIKNLPFVKGKTQDKDKLVELLQKEKIDAVIHFAAYIQMGESMENPYKYFENNFYGSLQLIKAMVEANVKKLVFSSTAGVYGNPERIPIREEDAKRPTNPYGETKLMVEKALKWFDQIHGLKYVCLRYFNAAGANLEGTLGEAHDPESHLIPNLIRAALNNEEFVLFGDDYDTKDGTCVRDYIHVLDLADAHILALDGLENGHDSSCYNVGTGQGFSNKEVVEEVKNVTGIDFPVKNGKRRAGDAAKLVANSTKLKSNLNWKPQYSDLNTIVTTAYRWHKNNG